MGTLWLFTGPCHLRGSVSQETIPAKIRHQFRQQIQEETSVSQEETPESKQSSTIILRNSRQPVPPCLDVFSNTELFWFGPCRLFVHLSRNHYRQFGAMWPSSNHSVRQKRSKGDKDVCWWMLARRCIQEVNALSHPENPVGGKTLEANTRNILQSGIVFLPAEKKTIASQKAFAINFLQSACQWQIGYSQLHLTISYLVLHRTCSGHDVSTRYSTCICGSR